MPTSENHLAVLMRDISNRRIAIPQLKGSEPLELLVEIGLEKISKDYEFIFNESKLINKNEFTVLTENVYVLMGDGKLPQLNKLCTF